MRHANAIVTIAIGIKYRSAWQTFCERNWQEYAARYGYDCICIDQPLDTTLRAQNRSPAWQKCLILSQPFAECYDRIVWMDSDIVINTRAAPDISANVPIEHVGAVSMYEAPTPSAYNQVLARGYEYWGSAAIRNDTPGEYYAAWGLPMGGSAVAQTGVMVFSPRHHREVLEDVYYKYEEKGGPEWHMEMRPLSYELCRANLLHWLDYRFNVMWPEVLLLHYPFVLERKAPQTYAHRLIRHLRRRLGLSTVNVKAAALTTTFLNSYFLHMGGSWLTDMHLLDQHCPSFLQTVL